MHNGAITLTERGGGTVSRDDLLGKVWIASFVVTRCPDGKCPSVMQTMQRLQKEMTGPADPNIRWATGILERQVSGLTRLVDDLLDVSRVSRGKIELLREPVAAHS